VTVILHFGIKAPMKEVRPFPTTKPDVDKLTRTCLDAITQAGNVWADDSQVIILTAAKYYEATPLTRIEINLDKTFDGMAAR
jgi:Holliday junction resolvase RusA-like endonuclease